MEFNVDSLVVLLIILGAIIFFIIKEYRAMSKEEKSEAKKDFKSKGFFFTVGLLLIGFILVLLGNLFVFTIVKFLGIIIMVIAGFNSFISMWKENKSNSVLIVLLIIVTILISL